MPSRQQNECLRREVPRCCDKPPTSSFWVIVIDQRTHHFCRADRIGNRGGQRDDPKPTSADVILRHGLTDDEGQYAAIANDADHPCAFEALPMSTPELFDSPASVATVIHSPKVCLQ